MFLTPIGSNLVVFWSTFICAIIIMTLFCTLVFSAPGSPDSVINSGLMKLLFIAVGIFLAAPVAVAFILCIVSGIYSGVADFLKARKAWLNPSAKGVCALRVFTRAGGELWVVWLPGLRKRFGNRVKETVFVYPCHGWISGGFWKDRFGDPEEWRDEVKYARGGRDTIVALEYSHELEMELKELGYKQMELEDFREAVQKWRARMDSVRTWRVERRQFWTDPFWQKIARLLMWSRGGLSWRRQRRAVPDCWTAGVVRRGQNDGAGYFKG